jgi:hypothetical protein
LWRRPGWWDAGCHAVRQSADRPGGRAHLPVFSVTVLLGFGMRMTFMFVSTSSSTGRATGLLPG